MRTDGDEAWSPAGNPYAIAVSEAWWWLRTVNLCAHRIREGHDPDRQIDARLFVLALSQLVRAAEMEAAAIRNEDNSMRAGLETAQLRFDELVPGLLAARNVLTHFDEYARGAGHLQRANDDPITAARQFWAFGYDPASGSVVVGPYRIQVDDAAKEAIGLFNALYAAARAFDARRPPSVSGAGAGDTAP
jgi:hypothetical protein